MSQALTISVVMPSYNHAHFIHESIESVIMQDYPDLDLLVMDGGSTDGTVDILKSYGSKLRYYSEKDRGQSDAINKGFSRVSGDIVCWLNSDDLFTPQAVSTIMKIFEEHPDVDYVYGNGWTIDERGGMLGDSGVLPFNLWKLIHQRNYLQQPSVFFRKTLLAKVGMIDESLHYVMDWELWIRFAAYKGIFTREFLSCNRTYNENKTQSGHLKRWREIRSVVRKYTEAWCPPILPIYLLEIIIQILASKRTPHRFLAPMLNLLMKLMLAEMSGWYADGAIKRHFKFSVGNPQGKSQIMLYITPLSARMPVAAGRESISISWNAGRHANGVFEVIENGKQQTFILDIRGESSKTFVHVSCQARSDGVNFPDSKGPGRSGIIGFLDNVSMQ